MTKISAMWLAIMKSGVNFPSCAHNDQKDEEFWVSHEKEIDFAFGVLRGLGLVKGAEWEETFDDIWVPTKKMRRFYKKHHCRKEEGRLVEGVNDLREADKK